MQRPSFKILEEKQTFRVCKGDFLEHVVFMFHCTNLVSLFQKQGGCLGMIILDHVEY